MDIQGWYDALPQNNVKDEMKAVLAKKDDSNHNDVVKEFGVACCKFNFPFNTIPQNNQSYQISQILPHIKILSRQTRSKVSF